MNLGQLRDEVQLITQEVGFSDSAVDGYINQALLEVAARVMLPGLKGVGTLTTSTVYPYKAVSFVSGAFSGHLVRVLNSDGESLKIASSLEVLMDEYGDLTDTGELEAVCLEGSVLWYAKMHSVAETLTLLYFKDPDVLEDDTDVPVCLPEFSHRILVHKACSMMFGAFEDEINGEGVNVRAQEYLAEVGVTRLQEWIGRSRRHAVSGIWSA